MKITSIFLVNLICIQLFAFSKKEDGQIINSNSLNIDSTKMKITIGPAIFTATLNNNTTVKAFRAMLPLTINMRELNGNEKFYYFSTILPTNALKAGSIEAGDLLLYENNCLVLFYKGFNSSYTYTELGHIDNTSGLVAALGAGNATIKFELEQNYRMKN